jgi:flavin reductase (DIM6/NTAB) family NADH-FMN oxidoreductase RutF
MTVGSFTSVSLDPPLVAFLPQAASASWARMRLAGSFCVNVLTHRQEQLCRIMATPSPDRFADVAWTPARSGAPVLTGAAAWVDCEIESVHAAGDHDIVVGRVRDLEVGEPGLPLLFYQGGYGRFVPRSLAAQDAALVGQFAQIDLARACMDELSSQFDVECLAVARVDDEVVVVASSGAPRSGNRPTRVGTRVPFLPPGGYVFAAWTSPEESNSWLEQAQRAGAPGSIDDHRRRLDMIRERGYSVGLGGSAHKQYVEEKRSQHSDGSKDVDRTRLVAQLAADYEPAELLHDEQHSVQTITVPLCSEDGVVRLALVLFGWQAPLSGTALQAAAEQIATRVRSVPIS